MNFHLILSVSLLILPIEVTFGQGSVSNLKASVEIEEDVYSYEDANNGAGPMWCHGGTSIVRFRDEVFASGIETILGMKPLNNCQPFLLHRTGTGWKRVFQENERTREPSPLAMFQAGQVFLSTNPTLTSPATYSGPARPGLYEFQALAPSQAPRAVEPVWEGEPAFSEHSYRSVAADGVTGELILLQNIAYAHTEWSFRDHHEKWSAQGKLEWPWGDSYAHPKPIRLCYPAVALKDRRVFLCGTSDVKEPNEAWRDYKRELTGREWDYDFRRLFFTCSDDITTGKFHEWLEISSREKTAGKIRLCDLYVAPNSDVFILWNECALDNRLRAKFFPNAKQRFSLECAILRDGKVVRRITLVEGGDGLSGLIPGKGRFHITKDNRLIVLYYQGGVDDNFRHISQNRILELDSNGNPSKPIAIKFRQPFTHFFTTTVRAGCRPSNTIDLFGSAGKTMRYARIRLH